MLGELLDFAGGLLGQSHAAKQASRNRKLSREQFDAQMDESVQRRVADARAAGVHPLFALGASVGASPTASTGYGQPSGSALGDAISRIGSRLAGARIARDEAEAALLNSERKRVEQDFVARGHDGVVTFPYGTNPGPEIQYGPAKFYNPEIPVSKAPGVVAGTLPGTVDIVFPDGRKIRTFSSELEADEIKQIDIIYQRAVHKGSDGFMWMRNQLRKIPWVKIMSGSHPKTKSRTAARSGKQ